MHWLDLPPPRKNMQPGFDNLESAKTWLSSQPQADPVQMQSALLFQVEALDASTTFPAQDLLALLDFLRAPSLVAQEALEPRYLRKPLPLPSGDQRIFETARQLWTRLGIAYLRISPHCAPAEKLLPLHRAASSIRLAEYCHLQAAQDCPALLDRLLFAILEQAEQASLQRQPLLDPVFRHLGQSHIAGHIAWAFLLRLIDPYRLSMHQLAVANRAISRWRELAAFQTVPDSDPKARSIPLDGLFGGAIPEGLPRWLDVRPVARKIRNRIEALQGGESPESLKLGRELSGAACIRLLQEMRSALGRRTATPATDVGEIPVVFGPDDAYTLLAGKPLQSQSLDAKSATLAHQRVAMFGFDRVSQLPNAVRKTAVPHEIWSVVDAQAIRPAEAGERHLSPCLIATANEKGGRLGALQALRCTSDGALHAQLSWYPEQIRPGIIKRFVGVTPLAVPVFVYSSASKTYLIAPANAAIKLDIGLTVEEQLASSHLTPCEVSERGSDFVRYLCHNA